MNDALIMTWWEEHFSGLEIDSCLAVDFPDNENGGPFASLREDDLDVCEDTIAAAFAYTLAKFTAQNESLFWIQEDGLCSPFYISFDEDAPTQDFLRKVSALRQSAAEHPLTDADALAQALDLHRDLFLSFDKSFLPAESGEARLCLQVLPGELRFFYRENLFHAENMRRFLKATAQVARQLTEYKKLKDLCLVSEDDLKTLESFPYRKVQPSAQSVTQILARAFSRYPDHTAVVYENETFSYAQLDRVSNAIAAKIASLGIGKGCVVSTLLPRCKWMPAVAIAVLKTGAAYQPLDPQYPPERLNFMVQDSAAALVIADRSLKDLLSEYRGPFLFTDEIDALPAAAPLNRKITPDDPFILLYTSGTTGTPKGVILSHGNLVSFIDWYVPKFHLTAESRSAAYASFGFDANMMDTYPILSCGGQMHILSDAVRFDLRAMNRYFNENAITHSFMTTQVGRQFALMTDCKSLRVISMGGETLVPFDPPRDKEVYNVYGPTECTILSTAYQMRSGSRRLPIGTPADNMRLYVADQFQRLLPIGAMGELLIAGTQVGLGYLNRPEKTAEVFVKNPYTDDPEIARVYRSGDIVRWGYDGNVEFVGRRDGQVKIRGFRIELTEVEGVLREYPGIKDVTVIARSAPTGGKMICAYVVSDDAVDIPALEQFILDRKPPYMVPAVTMQIDKIPLNVNSKVDKRALPEPTFASDEDAQAGPRVRTALEELLYEVISPVIGAADFPIDEKLDRMGLTSISALMLAVEIEDRFGYSPDVDVLGNSSLLEIENALVAHFMRAPDAQAHAEPAEGPYPLAQTQLGIYSACKIDPENDAYELPFLFKLSRNTDAARLCAALEQTIAAHDTVNCRIAPDRQHTAVMIPTARDFRAAVSDVTEAQLKAELAARPKIDFENGPLYDARVYRTEDAIYLYINFHHIIFDGTSLAVFMEDLETAFQGGALAPEKYSAFDLSLDERKARESDAWQTAKDYYDSVFAGLDVNSLPEPDFAGKEAPDVHAQKVLLGDGFPKKVQAMCERLHVTENAFFTFAFAYTLARVSGQEEALFCNIYNGRTDPRTFHTVGMLVKTYPFYISFSGNDAPADKICETAGRIRDLTGNDLYSFAEVSRAYNIKPDILFAYQGSAFNEFTVAGQRSAALPQGLADVQAPLSVDVFLEDDAYSLNAEYFSDRYTAEMIVSLLELFAQTAKQLLTADRLDAVDLMHGSAQTLLDTVNDTDWPVAYAPVHCLLEKSAEKYPQRLAVVTQTERLTYAQLNESANRVGHALIDAGVEPGQIVALMLPRYAGVYIVRQGILKSGGAFLSIAPDYPDDRVQVMIEDSGAKVLIVTDQVLSERRAFLDRLKCSVVTVDTLLTDARTDNPGVFVAPDALAYTIFTSGSTGKPKGVLLTQRNLVNFVNSNPKNPEILGYTERGHVSLALAAITFDVSIMEEFIPLSAGMTICMATEEEIHNPIALAKLMTENGVDMMTCTPSFLTNCIGLPAMRAALRNVVSYDFGAEAFPGSLYEKVRAVNPDAYIMNGYGPTEATVSCTMDVVATPDFITIGKPASNVKAFVLDGMDRKLPPLIPGELVIAGAGVGRGYIGRPDLTAEKFITIDNLPAYRTGDVAAWTADGRLRFRGRADDQVKLRGLRVELGEIENAINAVDGVLTSVVIMTGEDSNKFLAGYYTAAKALPPEEVRAQISRKLTAYMVPGVLTQLDEMPLTQNGKIDKKKLPKVTYVPDAADYVAPANEAERDFCGWFAELLNLDKVSATGNFFELGGTSLSAAIIAINAEEKGYPIVYADVFKAQTPRELAALATGATSPESEASDRSAYEVDDSTLALAHNICDELPGLTRASVGNLLLTGASGFLGIHVLREYLTQSDGTLYCLLRGKDPQQRLKRLYFYYFGEPLEPYFENGRIKILNGDITDNDSLKAAEEIPFDTLINCAALVKHFVKDDSLERINVQGVRNLIDLCKRTGKRLIQTSTVSVAGEGVDGTPPRDWTITENRLYHGQLLDNAYALSKYRAELAVLEAIADGLDAKIMRLGNLMGRHSDGEFQVNFRSNAFIRSLASYKAIGAVPYSLMNTVTDFSEIDMTARAILLLAGTDPKFTVFHPMNNHTVTFADIVYSMREYGFDIETVEDAAFAERMANAGEASGALIAYRSREGEERRYELGASCEFTAAALYRLGFKWPVSGEKYIVSMLKALAELNMFEE
ncbi:MAG: amino acid adenylation domain-containing protein [Clostridia bacterium]|nr:amino acid adenylation domain-containing protein [Clostridia bacterium]